MRELILEVNFLGSPAGGFPYYRETSAGYTPRIKCPVDPADCKFCVELKMGMFPSVAGLCEVGEARGC